MPARDMYQIRLFIENMGLGHTPTAAARLAGSKKPSRDGKEWIKDPDVLKQVQILQEENRKNSSLTRTDVMSNLIDAFNLGRTLADPQSMIRAMAEINRMSGYYAPEKKILELTDGARNLQEQLESLTKEQLLEMLDKQEETPLLEATENEDGEYVVEAA